MSSHGLSAHKTLSCKHTAYINSFNKYLLFRWRRETLPGFQTKPEETTTAKGRDEALSSRRIRPIRLIGPIVQPIGAYQQAHPACPAYTGSLQGNHPKTKTTAVRNARRQHNELVKRERVVKQAKAHEPRQRSLRLQSTWL